MVSFGYCYSFSVGTKRSKEAAELVVLPYVGKISIFFCDHIQSHSRKKPQSNSHSGYNCWPLLFKKIIVPNFAKFLIQLFICSGLGKVDPAGLGREMLVW